MAGRGAKRLPSASSLFLIHSVKVTRPGSPSGRPAHSRPGHAQWLLCRLMVEGLFPYTKRYLGTLRNHFSTIGVNGLNEMVRNFTDDQEDISTEQGRAFALKLLDHVRERMKQYQEETGLLYLSDTRVPERRTRILPEMRRAAARRPVTVGHDRHFPKKQRRSSAWITRNFPMTAN